METDKTIIMSDKKIDSINVTDEMAKSIAVKSAELVALLKSVSHEFHDIQFASSLGAEDMVIHHAIHASNLGIEIFTLDTGRLPEETHQLIDATQKLYRQTIVPFYPDTKKIELYVKENGMDAFYDSLEMRKECCHIRKVEPLKRALKGKGAWITGMRSEQSATRQALSIREFDEGNLMEKINPLAAWKEVDVWAYIKLNQVPYNALHDKFYPSIGCAPCTRAVSAGEDIRAGRWWWENPENKECGLHIKG